MISWWSRCHIAPSSGHGLIWQARATSSVRDQMLNHSFLCGFQVYIWHSSSFSICGCGYVTDVVDGLQDKGAGTVVKVITYPYQFVKADPAEGLKAARTCHYVTSAVLLQNKIQQMSITQEKSSLLDVTKNLLRHTSALEFCRYLYFCEAVWTQLGVDFHPAFAQKTIQSYSQNRAAISALQDAFPLFTATDIVFPQSHQTLWETHELIVNPEYLPLLHTSC